MTFVLVPHAPPPLPGADDSERRPLESHGGEGEGEGGVVIPTHRVIVAARCEYFKRALQSGMKEDIDKYVCMYVCMLFDCDGWFGVPSIGSYSRLQYRDHFGTKWGFSIMFLMGTFIT